MEANRRIHRGLAFQASYTLARNTGNIGGDAPTGFTPEVIYGTAVTDRYNLGADAGNIAATRRHRLLLTGTYELPFGTDRQFLNTLPPVAQVLIGGWSVSTVTLLQSGPYLTPTISPVYDAANVNALARGTIVRPDLVGDPTLSNPSPNGWWNLSAFAPTPANAGRVGNAGVGILRGPGTLTVAGGTRQGIRARRPASRTPRDHVHQSLQSVELRTACDRRHDAGDVWQDHQRTNVGERGQPDRAGGIPVDVLKRVTLPSPDPRGSDAAEDGCSAASPTRRI
jgi:hypothetical protein